MGYTANVMFKRRDAIISILDLLDMYDGSTSVNDLRALLKEELSQLESRLKSVIL